MSVLRRRLKKTTGCVCEPSELQVSSGSAALDCGYRAIFASCFSELCLFAPSAYFWPPQLLMTLSLSSIPPANEQPLWRRGLVKELCGCAPCDRFPSAWVLSACLFCTSLLHALHRGFLLGGYIATSRSCSDRGKGTNSSSSLAAATQLLLPQF